jgi:drug/metabolite transporter (DMT)-like permease
LTSNPLFYETLGYLAALGSALAWAFCSILFHKIGEVAAPAGMNLGKCLIGTVYLGIVMLIIGFEPIDTRTFLLLGVSGLLGIAVGDTFFFKALVSIGPRLTVLLATLGPVLTIVLAVVFLQEKLSLYSWIGAALTLTGVNIVLWDEGSPDDRSNKKWLSGIVYAVLASLCMALGIITAKVGVAETSAMQANLIRIFWGGIGLSLWGLAGNNLKSWMSPFKNTPMMKLILFSVFVVIFGGFWLSLVALKFIDASIASILNSTEPLFILPLTAIFLKEKVTMRGIVGTVVAVTGVWLIVTG